MKFLAVFTALVAVACGAQNSWSLQQISDAIESPLTDPAALPYLEQALNQMIESIFAGAPMETVSIGIPAVDPIASALAELSEAIQNPETDPAVLPQLEAALDEMMEALISGKPVPVTAAASPAMDISLWTLKEIDAALTNPSTNPALVPYLTNALDTLMNALISGQSITSIVIVTPAGILDAAPTPILPAPVETPALPAPVETPVLPAPVETPAGAPSPLVQIIININQKETAPVTPGGAITPVPEVDPTPVTVVDQAPVNPEPVTVVDIAQPEPVIVVEQTPESVSVIDSAFNPIDAVPVPGIIVPSPVVVPAVVGPMI